MTTLMRKTFLFLFSLLLTAQSGFSQKLRLGLLQYSGGGDWYANPTSLKNLAQFCNQALRTNLELQEGQVAAASPEIFNYAFIHLTGHGRWDVTPAEAQNLRTYLEGGGFLHIDDNYGLDPYVRPALKKIFPELSLVEVPFSHPVYRAPFSFPGGLPKIHEHDKKPPRGYGLFLKGKMVVFYSVETDLGDGWEDREVHNDNPEAHTRALQMGANLVRYAFMGEGG